MPASKGSVGAAAEKDEEEEVGVEVMGFWIPMPISSSCNKYGRRSLTLVDNNVSLRVLFLQYRTYVL